MKANCRKLILIAVCWGLVQASVDGFELPESVQQQISNGPSVNRLTQSPARKSNVTAEPIWRSLPATQRPTPHDAIFQPTYRDGNVVTLRVHGRFAYLVTPKTRIDSQKRWVWIFPFEHALNDVKGNAQHRFYVEKLLAAGFHVAGISVGVSCGSPDAADVCDEFYRQMVEKEGLNRRARLLAQSNGGLIAYAWAFRHPKSVDRIAGIYPAADVRLWPGLVNLLAYPSPGLGYPFTAEQLPRHIAECNPIDNLAPLAKAGVKVLHIHGDKDKRVPLEGNSAELVRRYKKLGGSAELIIVRGFAHGGLPFTESQQLIEFLMSE